MLPTEPVDKPETYRHDKRVRGKAVRPFDRVELDLGAQVAIADAPSRKLRVFLCHASDDKTQVRQLCANLRYDGFDPWLDEEVLIAGQEWAEVITRAVRESDAIIRLSSL